MTSLRCGNTICIDLNSPTELTVAKENDAQKVARFEAALDQLIERVSEDRYVLAVVLVGIG